MKFLSYITSILIWFILIPVVSESAELKTVIQDTHKAAITKLVFSPDGVLLATASDDGTVKLWNNLRGRLLWTFPTGKSIRVSISFSPDSKGLALYNDGRLILLQNESGKIEKDFQSGLTSSGTVYFFDRNHIVIVSRSGQVDIINVNDSTKQTILEEDKIITASDFLLEQGLLAYGEIGGDIKVFDIRKKKIISQLHCDAFYVRDISITIDGHYLASACGEALYLWDLKTETPIRILDSDNGDITNITFNREGKYLASIGELGKVVVYEMETGKAVDRLDNNATSIRFLPGEHEIVIGLDNGSLEIINLEGAQGIKKTKVTNVPMIMDISPDLAFLAASGKRKNISLFDLEKQRLEEITKSYGTNRLLRYSNTGKFLAQVDEDSVLHIWDVSRGSLIRSVRLSSSLSNFVISFSDSDKYLAIAGCESEKTYSLCETSSIIIIESRDWGIIKEIREKNQVRFMSFIPDGNYLIFSSFIGNYTKQVDLKHFNINEIIGKGVLIAVSADGKYLAFMKSLAGSSSVLDIWKLPAWKKVASVPVFHELNITATFSLDNRYIIYSGGEGKEIRIGDLDTGMVAHVLKGHEAPITKINTYKNIIASVEENGTVRLWSIEKGLITSLYIFHNAALILTPEGFFSGSGEFDEYVHFVKGLDVYDFNQFYDVFYRPDLVEKKLKGEDISEYTGGLNIDDAIKNPPPQVAILSPNEGDSVSDRTVTVKVQIKDTGGAIGDIRIHHNGKLVDSLGIYRLAKSETQDKQIKLAKADIDSPYQIVKRGTVVRRVWEEKEKKEINTIDFTPLTGTVEKTYTIPLIKGENTISVSAFNGTNTVMSAMESIKIKADIPERKPEVFVLAIGNNNFADASYNLSMAKKDAEDFSGLLKDIATPLYDKVHVQTLIDAKKSDVFDAIYSIQGQIKPEDIFILFAATHGRAEDSIYYLYTSDFDGNIRSTTSSISSVELMELSKRIPALKQVFVLDTCQSGSMENIVSGLYDARISVLAKALGMHIFAGTKTYQDAQDSYQGNGLFTYFILDGLKGQADEDKNKQVTVFEMNPYLTAKVKEASGGRQEPFIRNFGDDLPLAKVINP